MAKESNFGPRPVHASHTLAGCLQRGKGECLRDVLISRSCHPIYDVICNTDFEDRRELPEYFGRLLLAIDADAMALVQEADRIQEGLGPSQDPLVTSGGRRVDMIVKSVVQAAIRGHGRSRAAIRFAFVSSSVWEHVLGEITFCEQISDDAVRALLGPWPVERIDSAVASLGDCMQRWAKWEPRLARALKRHPRPSICADEDCDCVAKAPLPSRSDASALASAPGFITNEASALQVLDVMEVNGGCRDEEATSFARKLALEHASPVVRGFAGSLLGRVGDETLRSALIVHLRGDDAGFSCDALGGYLAGLPVEAAVDLARRVRCMPGTLGRNAVSIMCQFGCSGDYGMMKRELKYAMKQGFDHRLLLILRAWPSFEGSSDDRVLHDVFENAPWLGARYEAYRQMRASLTDVWRGTCTDALWDASAGIRRLACSAFRMIRCPVPERLAEIVDDPFAWEAERTEAREALRSQ